MPVVVEIDTFFTSPAKAIPKFETASVLDLVPGESLLSVLSTPLVKEVTTQGTSAQELISSKWLGKKEIQEGAIGDITFTNPTPNIRVLGHTLSELSISFAKHDALDLTITAITASLTDPKEDVLDGLTKQFGPPTKGKESKAEWHAEDGLILRYSPPHLQLLKSERESNTENANPAVNQLILLQ